MKRSPTSNPQRPRKSVRIVLACLVSAILSLMPLAVLSMLAVPLGETGRFIYRYSSFLSNKLITSAMILVPLAVVLAAVWLLDKPRTRKAGYGVAVLAILALGAWSFWAPPAPIVQHAFNL